MAMYTNEMLTCVDCGRQFPFTAGEQEFFAMKGFTNKPNRCTDCRAARKAGAGKAVAAAAAIARCSKRRAASAAALLRSRFSRAATSPFTAATVSLRAPDTANRGSRAI